MITWIGKTLISVFFSIQSTLKFKTKPFSVFPNSGAKRRSGCASGAPTRTGRARPVAPCARTRGRRRRWQPGAAERRRRAAPPDVSLPHWKHPPTKTRPTADDCRPTGRGWTLAWGWCRVTSTPWRRTSLPAVTPPANSLPPKSPSSTGPPPSMSDTRLSTLPSGESRLAEHEVLTKGWDRKMLGSFLYT